MKDLIGPARKQNRSDEELAMRDLIVPELRKRWPGARIVHELPLRYSERRIDLAAILPGEIIAVEIKSSRDTCERLEKQLRGFRPVASQIIVCLAPAHYEKAQTIIASVGRAGIGTWKVSAEHGHIEEVDRAWGRRAVLPWLSVMLDMLWNSELITIAERHRIALGKRPNHEDLIAACAAMMTGREVVASVCAALRSRPAFGEASDPPLTAKNQPK